MKLRITILLATLAAAVAATSTAAAPSGLTIIGNGHRSAQGSKTDAHALYIRGYGHNMHVSYRTHCVGGPRRWDISHSAHKPIRSGRLYPLSTGGNPFVPEMGLGDCTVTATVRGTGRLRLQILAS